VRLIDNALLQSGRAQDRDNQPNGKAFSACSV
jgi:hypothetical protein